MTSLKTLFVAVTTVFCLTSVVWADQKCDYPVTPVKFTDVRVSDCFWRPRLDAARDVTIPDCFQKCEPTRIPNFARAAGMEQGPFKGIYYDDSDVYKIIEGASYVLALEKNEELDKYVDSVIEKIAGAQEEDGYLYTARTIYLKYPQYKPLYTPPGAGERWSKPVGNELYNAGHLYEAAVAHYLATGKRNFLDVAIKHADLICNTFGVDKKQNWPPEHQEIEIGLVKLYRVTGDKKYLDQAKYFLDLRGRSEGRTFPMYGRHYQDHQPVVEQTEAFGHAVRAGYMYSGMADVAAMTGDESYVKAINAIWNNVVGTKLYVTGGVGSTRRGEAFEDSYILPNDTAYCETCANIANVYWNHRMFLWTGESKYIDVLERSLYNSVLSGINLVGDHYFYPNVLDAPNGRERSAWFGCSCCPSNLSRFLPSMPGYIYAVKDDFVYINLYAQSEATLKGVTVDGKPADVKIKVETKYPWDGSVKVTVLTDGAFTVKARIPGWSVGEAVPEVDGNRLHTFINFDKSQQPTCAADGKDVKREPGYFVLSGTWKAGDSFTLNFPMQTLKVVTDERVKADVGLSCIQRGPLVYCIEAQDCVVKETGKAPSSLHALVLADDSPLSTEFRSDLLNGVMTVKGTLKECVQEENGTVTTRDVNCIAIPYYSWANRGLSPMLVYFPRTVDAATPVVPTKD
ncbi:MAG: glycoside hydrolase family 127 protein [Thermoguttaceae bacterium]|nr:glycoside hydrolase family 127 protein [Thermoguttaceae bacterium]